MKNDDKTNAAVQRTGLSGITGSALLSIYKDGWTGGIQLSIGDKNGGYRIAGPKFNGSGKPLLEHRLTERDAKEIRYYLDCAFPQNTEMRNAPSNEP